jgi:hypothetical protein
MAQPLAGQTAGEDDRRPRAHDPRRAARPGVFLLAALFAALANGAAEEPHRLGGCRTVERELGTRASPDTLAVGALAELTAPGMGPKAGPICRRLGVDAPLFVSIGAVDEQPDSTWMRVADQVGDRMRGGGLHMASRSPLRHTTGTCFPPYHIDFEAVGDSARVGGFLARMARASWEPLIVAERRQERVIFIAAGLNRQSMDTVVDLKLR